MLRSLGRKAVSRSALHATGAEGPVAAIRAPDGAWARATWSLGGRTVTDSKIVIERRGPVAAVARSETRLSDGTVWTLRTTVQASDPAVLFEETWSAPVHAAVAVTVAPTMPLDRLTFRIGSGQKLGMVTTQQMPAEGEVTLEIVPWLHWWLSEKRAIYGVASSDRSRQALTVAALHPQKWVAPARTKTPPPPVPIVTALTANGLALRFPANGTARDWLIAFSPVEAALDPALVGQMKALPAQKNSSSAMAIFRWIACGRRRPPGRPGAPGPG